MLKTISPELKKKSDGTDVFWSFKDKGFGVCLGPRQLSFYRINSHDHTKIIEGTNMFDLKSSFHPPPHKKETPSVRRGFFEFEKW